MWRGRPCPRIAKPYNPMHILIIGAHPDDGAIYAGGCAALWRRRGDTVRFLSITDGSRSHYDPRYARDPRELAERCATESAASAEMIGATCRTLGVADAA